MSLPNKAALQATVARASAPGLHPLDVPLDWHLPRGYQFQEYEQWFHDFTAGFRQGSDFDVGNVDIKINHSLRVLELARKLTAALPLPVELRELAHLAALFHDVGRFPQYARYQTFHDQKSVNHGLQGVITLKQHQVLAALPAAAQKLVLAAVGLHNRRALPAGLAPLARYLTWIVRDADKLDIFAVMLAHFHPEAPPNKVVNLGLNLDPEKYTPAILAAVQQRQMVNYHDMVWVNDFKLLLASWLYDLNFAPSKEIVRERRYLDQLCTFLPPTEEFRQLHRQLAADLAAALSSP